MGSGSEFERDLPFGVFVDALDDYVASQMLDTEGATDREWLQDLAGVLPASRRGNKPVAGGAPRPHPPPPPPSGGGPPPPPPGRGPPVFLLGGLPWGDPPSGGAVAS